MGGAAGEVAAGLRSVVVDGADKFKSLATGLNLERGAVAVGHAHEGAVVLPGDPLLGIGSEALMVVAGDDHVIFSR